MSGVYGVVMLSVVVSACSDTEAPTPSKEATATTTTVDLPCDPAYRSPPCVPHRDSGDVDCSDVGYRVYLHDPSDDPHHLDSGFFTGDGRGCRDQPEHPSNTTTTSAPQVATTTTSAPAAAAPPEDDPAAVVPGDAEQTGGDSSGSGAAESVEAAAGSEGAVAALLSRLEALPVLPERRSGYDRDLFDHWVDADGDRCDARREVLIAEAVEVPRVGSSCSLSGGQWYSVYDGATETGTGSGFDVDHLVPLAEAWDSGAYGWDSDTRRRYANDLGYEHSLVAVSASSNRQKGASDPADWLPPDVSVRCWYAEAWISVKTRWELSVDSAELGALRALISQCEDS